eukprot:3836889-Amphidinium_carterae.1
MVRAVSVAILAQGLSAGGFLVASWGFLAVLDRRSFVVAMVFTAAFALVECDGDDMYGTHVVVSQAQIGKGGLLMYELHSCEGTSPSVVYSLHDRNARDWGALLGGLFLLARCFDSCMLACVLIALGLCGWYMVYKGRRYLTPPSARQDWDEVLQQHEHACAHCSPSDVLGVRVCSLSPPIAVARTQKPVRGHGNCFWRACSLSSNVHWRTLKQGVFAPPNR